MGIACVLGEKLVMGLREENRAIVELMKVLGVGGSGIYLVCGNGGGSGVWCQGGACYECR